MLVIKEETIYGTPGVSAVILIVPVEVDEAVTVESVSLFIKVEIANAIVLEVEAGVSVSL